MLERVREMLVERRLLEPHPFHQLDGKLACVILDRKTFEQRGQVVAAGAAADINPVQSLERKLAPLMSKSHSNSTVAGGAAGVGAAAYFSSDEFQLREQMA